MDSCFEGKKKCLVPNYVWSKCVLSSVRQKRFEVSQLSLGEVGYTLLQINCVSLSLWE